MTINPINDILCIKEVERQRAQGKEGKIKMIQEKRMAEEKNKKEILTKGTKYLLDFMFYSGVVVTATLPLSIKWIGNYIPRIKDCYGEIVMIYFVLGIAALVLIGELRKIFRTVLKEDCFVRENAASLRKMGNWSFFIVLMSVVRSIVYLTAAMLVVILVFLIAGLFSKVLACVFEEAIDYKEENELTI